MKYFPRLPLEGQVGEWGAENPGGGRDTPGETAGGDREDKTAAEYNDDIYTVSLLAHLCNQLLLLNFPPLIL